MVCVSQSTVSIQLQSIIVASYALRSPTSIKYTRCLTHVTAWPKSNPRIWESLRTHLRRQAHGRGKSKARQKACLYIPCNNKKLPSCWRSCRHTAKCIYSTHSGRGVPVSQSEVSLHLTRGAVHPARSKSRSGKESQILKLGLSWCTRGRSPRKRAVRSFDGLASHARVGG